MDNPTSPSGTNDQQPASQPEATSHLETAPPQLSSQPSPGLSDADARALLATHNLQTGSSQLKQSKHHIGLLVTIATLIILALFTSYMLGSLKSKDTSKSTTSNSGQPTAGSTNDSTTNQINQDVNSCSNVTTAVSEC